MIIAEHLTKKFGEKTVLNDVSFTVRDGRITGFVGPNGSGKSTTMRTMLGLITPNAGRTLIDGQEFVKSRAPMTTAGAVLDAKSAHKNRSAYEHLHSLALTNGIPIGRVSEVMEITGLSNVSKEKAKNFSLGMSQRLSIAAALLGDPHNLILDEPINGLDAEGVRWVRQLCRDYASMGRAVLLSSHMMNEIALTADDLVIIGRGKIMKTTSVVDFINENSTSNIRVATSEPEKLYAIFSEESTVTVRQVQRRADDAPDGEIFEIQGVQDYDQAVRLFAAAQLPTYELLRERTSLEDAYVALTNSQEEYVTRRIGVFGEGQASAKPQVQPQTVPQFELQPQSRPQLHSQSHPQSQVVPESQPQAMSQPQPRTGYQPAPEPIARVPFRQPRLTFGGSVHAEFVKLYSLSSTWWFTGIFVGLIWVAGILVGRMTKSNDMNAVARGEDFVDLAHIISLPMFIVVMAAVAVLAITGEYSNMSVQSALVANPNRVSYFGSKAVVVFCHAFVSTLIASLLALVSLSAFSSGHNISSNYDDYYHPWTSFVSTVGAALAVGLFSLIALGIGAICRSTAGAMVLMIFMGGMFPGSLLILAAFTQVRFFLWLSWYMPSSCVDVFLAGYTTKEVQEQAGLGVMAYGEGAPNWWQSGLLLGLWALVFMAIGIVVIRHRDVK